ncbi:MAG: PEGA domain-containing protein [Myxococcales bacterium]|nr:PEGA domain-containing protein [Myxococcales bacterium]
MPRGALLLGLALLLSLAPLASPLAPPLAAQAQGAKELFDQGVRALQAGRYSEAARALDASYRQHKVPATLYNLALAYQGMGYPGKAHQAFESYVQFADPAKEATTIQGAKGETRRLRGAHGRFALKLTPAEAIVEVDGKRAKATAGELWIATGSHRIAIHAEGYERYEQALQVSSGQFDLEIRLRRPSGTPSERADALVTAGMSLQSAGDFAGAMAKYRQAEAIEPTPRGSAQMGLAEEQLGDPGAAARHLDKALRSSGDSFIRKHRGRLKRARERVSGQLGMLDVKGTPVGAEVFINDRPVGKLPFSGPLHVVAGSVRVGARMEGYADFEARVQIPARGFGEAMIQMQPASNEAPAPTLAPITMQSAPAAAAPAPPAAPPAAPAPAPAPPPQPPPPAAVAQAQTQDQPPAVDEPRPESGRVSDIEDFSDRASEAPSGKPPEQLATGFETTLGAGHLFWLSGPETDGSSGAFAAQLNFGARVAWPVSFGLQLNTSVDLDEEGVTAVIAANPGLYVRGHVQREKRDLWFDVWGGIGFQPITMQFSMRESEKIDPTMIDLTAADQTSQTDIARRQLGVGDLLTIQSVNLPLELGAVFYVTKTFGFHVAGQLTFWFPIQECIHDGDDAICVEEGLEDQTSLSITGGLSFLP